MGIVASALVCGGASLVWHDLERSRVKVVDINMTRSIYKVSRIWPEARVGLKGMVHRCLVTHAPSQDVLLLYGHKESVERSRISVMNRHQERCPDKPLSKTKL